MPKKKLPKFNGSSVFNPRNTVFPSVIKPVIVFVFHLPAFAFESRITSLSSVGNPCAHPWLFGTDISRYIRIYVKPTVMFDCFCSLRKFIVVHELILSWTAALCYIPFFFALLSTCKRKGITKYVIYAALIDFVSNFVFFR